jgi:hypothetical protein
MKIATNWSTLIICAISLLTALLLLLGIIILVYDIVQRVINLF